jgi:leader peptidase (prepilin peptidase)/N-methyltransferase
MDAATTWLVERIAFLALAVYVGGSIGSFAGLALDRVPRGRSVLWPPSSCDGCARSLAIWENVPVLAWCVLRGRCRTCKAPIGWRTMALEGVLALAAAGIVWWQTGLA